MSKIEYNVRNGIVSITAQFPEFRRVMEAISSGIKGSSHSRWSHLEYYDLDTYPMDRGYHMGRIGKDQLYPSNRELNLSWLRATTLNEGINIELEVGNPPKPQGVLLKELRLRTCLAIQHVIERQYIPTLTQRITKNGREVQKDETNLLSVETSGDKREGDVTMRVIRSPQDNAPSTEDSPSEPENEEFVSTERTTRREREARRVSYTGSDTDSGNMYTTSNPFDIDEF